MWLFGVPGKAKKHLAMELDGKKGEQYKATMEFLNELNPPLFSRAGMFGTFAVISKALSFLPKIGGAFEPPSPFSKITSQVNLKAAFSEEVFPNAKTAQKKLDSLKLGNKNNKIGATHFAQLREAVADRSLNDKSLRKAYVTAPEMRQKSGKLVNINPERTHTIAAHKIVGGNTFPDKIESVVARFGKEDKEAFLKRLNCSKLKLSQPAFEKLQAIAEKQGLDVYADLKVKPENIETKKIDTPKLTKLIVEAAKSNQPLKLAGNNISKCNLEKAFADAETRLAKEGKTLNKLRISGNELEGAKMSRFQQQVFDKVLTERTPPQDPLNLKRVAVTNKLSDVVAEKVQSTFVKIIDMIGQSYGISDMVRSRTAQVEQTAGAVR